MEQLAQSAERESNLPGYFQKMKGKRRDKPAGSALFDVFISWLGRSLNFHCGFSNSYLRCSFNGGLFRCVGGSDIRGSRCAPGSTQKRYFGHILSATTGVIVYSLFGLTWWSTALGCSLSIALMLLTKTTHPPAGATGMVAVWTQQSPMFIVAPVAIGAVILVIIGLITNNISPRRSYPKYWS